MIRKITKRELPACLEVFHKGYETVAVEFGLTEDNCPDRGRASLPLEKLVREFEDCSQMFGCFAGEALVGFMSMRVQPDGVSKLNDIIVLPEHRGKGYGGELLDFCKKTAKESGSEKLQLGMIDDNKRLKNWYIKNGFVNTGHHKFEKAPFTVGFMEFILK